ncbi:MAG: hypothetical protein G01um101433_758 [Parcubacteria group bacterium Gr01-1014_33]|nr:MAG: hypothetical protein G01um101433_758 [Parcubacteria group bacterium Gr01-1014_33]
MEDSEVQEPIPIPIPISIQEIMSLLLDLRAECEVMTASLREAKVAEVMGKRGQSLPSLEEALKHCQNAGELHGEIKEKFQKLLLNLK